MSDDPAHRVLKQDRNLVVVSCNVHIYRIID